MKNFSLALLLSSLASLSANAADGCNVAFDLYDDFKMEKVAKILTKKGFTVVDTKKNPEAKVDFTFKQTSATACGERSSHFYSILSLHSGVEGEASYDGTPALASAMIQLDWRPDYAIYPLRKLAFAKRLPSCEEAKKLSIQLGK